MLQRQINKTERDIEALKSLLDEIKWEQEKDNE